ncbi:DNA helicase-2 / ATP-dependent DNA helicase PcrA [Evansella caseinilytica]|uniref:DNA helicase-2 / ATP-dependent DNA helicase PcrA n=1 Tax=Evansella caseinilytica TaxID=1503961 RepID=A0A1H3R2E2_9BACI|nr:RNA polymerase recycling motor HelD [Evansella caseinilytica]SDZ19119.1 DNA helicase-2 / ATP-dependent DNA helicase PcrA [Evansella caseinilytica]
MTKRNDDWLIEQKYVDNVKLAIERKLDTITENAGDLKESIIELRRNFWDDVTINLDDIHEVGETFTSIKQQVELLSERERAHKQSYKQLQSLRRLAYSPFFGRIDFRENGEEQAEKIYIGLASLMDESEDQFLIYDWRAPISSLYYNYSPGPAEYEVPNATIAGEIELKRQYIIKNGRLKSMFDTGVTIGDEMLQEVLSNNANTQMKTIVATIQKEQNQIIRNEKSKYLIVQGVAGSGKTSAALQRVAYLLYRYRGQLQADNMMLFSPNFLFNSYVATVLPELGEENMQQTTFQSYVEQRLGREFTIEDPFDQMEYIYSDHEASGKTARMAAIRYKATDEFKKVIDAYLALLSHQGIIFKAITFRGAAIFSANEISEHFYSLDNANSISNRLHLTAEWLLRELAIFQKKEWKNDWVKAEIELMDKEEYLRVFREIESIKSEDDVTFNDFDMEEKLLAKQIVKQRLKPVKIAIKKLFFADVKRMYRRLFTDDGTRMLSRAADLPDEWADICSLTVEELDKNELKHEDATPYLYFSDQLRGKKSNTTIRHLFIDEAQDYSPFQFAFFKQLFPNSRMTILGDGNQAIFAHTMNSPTLLSPEVFAGVEHTRITLKRSYRSTRPIVEFTKRLIAGGEEIEPFNRDGEKPTLTETNDKKQFLEKMLLRISLLQESGHQTIAVICKTAKESRIAFRELGEQFNVQLMDKAAQTFSKGILVLPAYLAKGIEFDAVIIYNAADERYGQAAERKLFYTACTRAMHELHLFSAGPRTRFLDEVDESTYHLL